MTNPIDAHVPAPWLPDYEHLRARATSNALVACACITHGALVSDEARTYARAALAYDTAAGEALTAWSRALNTTEAHRMTYLSDVENLTAVLLPPNSDHLATVDSHASAVRVVVHLGSAHEPDVRVDPDARCRLVVAIARRLEEAGGSVVVAPSLHGCVFSAIGRHVDGRDVIVTAALDDDEAEYLAARLLDGAE
jgi:uncharacterized iron-regulated membrane protein